MKSSRRIPNPLMYPSNSIDADVCDYIESNPDGNYDAILKVDKRLAVARYLSDIPNGLFAWYAFKKDASILVVGSLFGSFLYGLKQRCKSIVVVESDQCRATSLKRRFRNYEGLEVVGCDLMHYVSVMHQAFDYVIWAHDDELGGLAKTDYEKYFSLLTKTLNNDGVILALIPNKLGVRYLCGEPFEKFGYPFGWIDNENGCYYFTKSEIVPFLERNGIGNSKIYSIYPDYRNPQIIYTDSYAPSEDIEEKLRVYLDNHQERLLSERSICRTLGKEGVLNAFANHFIVECGCNKISSNIIYSAITSERNRLRAFATNICMDGVVRKVPIYEDGVQHLNDLSRHSDELSSRGVPSLKISIVDGIAEMDRINAPTLSQHIRKLVDSKEVNGIWICVDKLHYYILKSSDITSINAYLEMAPDANWGPILQKAFVEMIPVNCFYVNGEFLYFDQEYALENCPAGYVMFRVINDIYKFIPELDEIIPIDSMQKRYGLHELWNCFERMEESFCSNILNIDMYAGRSRWLNETNADFIINRKVLKMHADSLNDLFNPTLGLGDKKILVFGAGRYSTEFIHRTYFKNRIECILDNNSDIWGQRTNGFPVRDPKEIKSFEQGTYRIVVAVANYRAIINQLNAMGIYESDYRIFDPNVDELLNHALCDTKSDGKYHIGYVTGAFDLFHIGHLNLLKRCKERCHYLVAGVLTDSIIENEKHKKPFIPFDERVEIVRQCKYVDRAIAVDSHNTNKINAWKELKYGCLFSGSDHENEPYWVDLQMQLRSLGSELEFFPYTMSTSSTMLQKAISERLDGAE